MTASRNSTAASDQPVTLHRVIRQALARGLRERYEIEREIPHELFVILMQMNQLGPEAEKA